MTVCLPRMGEYIIVYGILSPTICGQKVKIPIEIVEK